MNTRFKQSIGIALSVISALAFTACDEEPPLPDNVIAFEATEVGMTNDESELVINLSLSRAVPADASITVGIETSGVSYGTDFTTTPAVENNSITALIPKDATSAQITVSKTLAALFDGDEKITLTLSSADEALVIGEKASLVITFAEIISEQATMTIQGGGAKFPNRVFIDLSASRQTSVERVTWDLGVYTVQDEFRVILNSSVAMLAKPLAKTDLATVTAADTVGFGKSLITEAFSSANLPYMDDATGDMTKTAMAAVAATETDNKVYIINRGKDSNNTQRSWKKVRVLRNGTGYTIQHADIASTTFQSINVTRDNAKLFNYVSLDQNATIDIEPAKDRWDIAYTPFLNTTNMGAGFIPYLFNDIIIQNRNGVATAELLVATAGEYANFDESDLTNVTFSNSQINIGSKWRTGGGPTSAPALRTDRFYVIKDPAGNIYKLKFTSLTQDGERGKPSIEFALLKKGS